MNKGLVATLLIAGASIVFHHGRARADIDHNMYCTIHDTQNSEIIYEFAGADDGFNEVGYVKNGHNVQSYPNGYPHWSMVKNQMNSVNLHPANDPGWFLSLGVNDPRNNVSKWPASLIHGDNIVGTGNCMQHMPHNNNSGSTVASSSAGNNVVALRTTSNDHSSQIVRVGFGTDKYLDMILDTGATGGSIPQSQANWLVNHSYGSWGPSVDVSIADGSVHTQDTIFISDLTLGGHVIHNIRMAVGPDGSDGLLGMNVLKQFGRFTIDTVNGTLTLGN